MGASQSSPPRTQHCRHGVCQPTYSFTQPAQAAAPITVRTDNPTRFAPGERPAVVVIDKPTFYLAPDRPPFADGR